MLGGRARLLGSSDVRFYVLLTAALDAQTRFLLAGHRLVALTAAVALFTLSATHTKPPPLTTLAPRMRAASAPCASKNTRPRRNYDYSMYY